MLGDRAKRVGAMFDAIAPSYETVVPWFRPIADRLVDELAPHQREHVLDMGCGTGAVVLALNEAVGDHGRIVGLDVSHRMLERAKAAATARSLHNVEFYEVDAAHPDLPKSSFSMVTASLVLPFLADPVAALATWRQILVPEGKIGVTTFAGASQAWDQLDELFRPYLRPDTPDPRRDRPDLFGSDHAVAQLFVQAGYEKIRTTHVEIPVTFTGADEWRRWTKSVGQNAWWGLVPPSEDEAVYQRAKEILERGAGAGQPVTLVQTVRITTARRGFAS